MSDNVYNTARLSISQDNEHAQPESTPTTPPSESASESSQHSQVWETSPEYIALFRDSPEDAATVLKNLFFSHEDNKILSFLLSFLQELERGMQRSTLFLLQSSDFPCAILDVVSDERWLRHMSWLTEEHGYDVTESEFAFLVFCSLHCLLRFINTITVPRLDPSLCERYRERFSDLWRTLWLWRVVALREEFARSRGTIFPVVEQLMDAYFLMYEGFLQRKPPLTSYVVHVLFHVWFTAFGPPSFTHSAAYNILETLQAEDIPTSARFLHDVVPLVIGSTDPVELLSGAIIAPHKELLEPSNLLRTLRLTALLSKISAPGPILPEIRQNALFTLYRAFQRCECSGNMSANSHVTQGVSVSILNAFHSIYRRDKAGVTSDILEYLVTLNFVRVVALSIVYAYTTSSSPDLGCKESIEVLVSIYKTSGARRSYYNSRRSWKDYPYFRRLLQVHWLPVLNSLRTALQEIDSNATTNPNVTRTNLRGIIRRWEELGRIYKFSNISREDDSLQSLISYVSPQEKLKGCFSPECACYGHDLWWHKTRRVCKGCWVAFYCNQYCQRRDWELGHKISVLDEIDFPVDNFACMSVMP